MRGPAQQSADANAAAMPPLAAKYVFFVASGIFDERLQNGAVRGSFAGTAGSADPFERL